MGGTAERVRVSSLPREYARWFDAVVACWTGGRREPDISPALSRR